MKGLEGTFNQEKALVGASYDMIVKLLSISNEVNIPPGYNWDAAQTEVCPGSDWPRRH